MLSDNQTQKFIQGFFKNLTQNSLQNRPKNFFPAEKMPLKNGTSLIPIYGSNPPPQRYKIIFSIFAVTIETGRVEKGPVAQICFKNYCFYFQ